jgi:2-methylcitrate dehydratase
MREHVLRVTDTELVRDNELAWLLAVVASDETPADDAVVELLSCRVLDSIGIAVASRAEPTVARMRSLASRHSRDGGAYLFGNPDPVDCAWAAWANSAALRQRDLLDMYVATEYAHPSDCIPAILAVAQHYDRTGADLIRGLAAAYEIHVALARSIPLSKYGLDPVGHALPATVCGIGALLQLPTETIYQAVQQAVQSGCLPRRMPESRSSDWRILCPANAARASIEILLAASAGLTAPSPAYESPNGPIARFLNGSNVDYVIRLPSPGEAKRGALATFPKAHEAQYQSHAFIDLALRLYASVKDPALIARIDIRTSSHMHMMVGTAWHSGAAVSPRTDHDLALIIATILEDGELPAVRDKERAARRSTAALRARIHTIADDNWSRRSHLSDPAKQSFGGDVTVTMADGGTIVDRVEWADGHPNLNSPWDRDDYRTRFKRLCEGAARAGESDRIAEQCGRLGSLSTREVRLLNPIC